MTSEEKLKLITRNLEEVLTEEELKRLIESDTPLRHYIGFEISGKFHIGYLLVLNKVKDLQEAGAETIIWLADIHSAINDKLGGDLETIKNIGKNYFTDGIKAIFESIGGDPEKLIFKTTSEVYGENPQFWLTFLEMGKTTYLARTKRSLTIMGREQSDDSIDTAKLMYPILQAADIFLLQANIAHAGIDQRKVHVIARDNALQIKTNALKDINGNPIKPVAIHHPILLGLQIEESNLTGEVDEQAMRSKMSKSKSDSGVLIHDLPEEIRKKINAAYAPEGQVENNPILNWTRYLVFYEDNVNFSIKRDPKWGENLTYTSYEDLEKDYAEKKLHPQDLKTAVAEWLIDKLEPARKYFEEPERQKALKEIERLTIKV